MLFSIEKREDLEKSNNLFSLNNQLDELRLQDELRKRSFHEQKNYEPLTITIKDTSRDISKTITETSIKNNKALGNLNNKLLRNIEQKGYISNLFDIFFI